MFIVRAQRQRDLIKTKKKFGRRSIYFRVSRNKGRNMLLLQHGTFLLSIAEMYAPQDNTHTNSVPKNDRQCRVGVVFPRCIPRTLGCSPGRSYAILPSSADWQICTQNPSYVSFFHVFLDDEFEYRIRFFSKCTYFSIRIYFIFHM